MPVVRVKTYQHICFPCVHIFHLLLSFHHHPLFQCFLRLSPWRKTHFSTIRLENLFCICDGGYFGSGSPLNVYVQVCVCVCVHVCVFMSVYLYASASSAVTLLCTCTQLEMHGTAEFSSLVYLFL